MPWRQRTPTRPGRPASPRPGTGGDGQCHTGRGRERGQAAVETVAVLPALALLGVAAWWIVAGSAAWMRAGSAARAAARVAAVAPASPVARPGLPIAAGVRLQAVHVGADGIARARAAARVPAPGPLAGLSLGVQAEAAGR